MTIAVDLGRKARKHTYKSAILLHPFAEIKIYAQKMQDAQVTKSLQSTCMLLLLHSAFMLSVVKIQVLLKEEVGGRELN